MQITQKQAVIGMVLMAVLAYGSGYGIARLKMGEIQHTLDTTALDNRVMEKQIEELQGQKDAILKELTRLKEISGVSLTPPPYVLDEIKRSGVTPDQLLLDLAAHPEVIPDPAVLGGVMGFTRVGIVDQRWVYGAYEDGHIAGATIFQWEAGDSGIAWVPVLVLKD